jgi:hypothetical protein
MEFAAFFALLLFTKKFPFVKFRKRYSPNEYHKVSVNELNSDEKLKKLLAENKELLLLNQVPLDKIRFTFQPTFTYDVDNNVINPKYEIFIPLREDGSGLFDKRVPVIEVNKPNRLVHISVNSYSVSDNYQFIKNKLQNNKRGIVIFLADEFVTDFGNINGEKLHYHYSVDTTVIRMINLDEEIEKYNTEIIDTEHTVIK